MITREQLESWAREGQRPTAEHQYINYFDTPQNRREWGSFYVALWSYLLGFTQTPPLKDPKLEKK